MARNTWLLAFAVLAGTASLAAAGGGVIVLWRLWQQTPVDPGSEPSAGNAQPAARPAFNSSAPSILPPETAPASDPSPAPAAPEAASNDPRPTTAAQPNGGATQPAAPARRARIRRPTPGKNNRPPPAAQPVDGRRATAR